MNVLHLDEQRGWRGGEQQASWLLQGQAARGHNVFIAGRRGSAFLEEHHGGAPARRFKLAFRGEWDLLTASRLMRIIRRERIDILHAHTSHTHMLACLARNAAGQGRVVVSRRVSFLPRAGRINRWKYRQPNLFVAVSGAVADSLRRYGIPEHRIELVHSAVDPARLDVAPVERAALGIPESAPLVLSAGALVDHKDHATLLDAWPILLEHFPHAHLIVAGEGPLRGQLEAQLERLRIQDSVQLLGHRSDAPALVRAADLYVSSSWSEGLGTSVLEALAAVTPVVATEAGGVGEMVLDGKTGWLVHARDPERLGEAMAEALRDAVEAERRAAAGRAHVEANFLVERMVEGNLRAYERALEQPGGRS